LGFRDLIDRITGRQQGRSSYGSIRSRSRSEPTVQLPKSGPPQPGASAERVHTDPVRPSPRPFSQATPAIASKPAPASARAAGPAPADAPTVYQPTTPLEQGEVAGILVAIDGELKGEVFRLFDGENKLGRADSSDVVLASKWISREHAMVVHQEGVFAIVPLTEKNRTYVNGQEIDGAELSDGDVIRLGHTTFRFRSVEGL
jgi:hypothetical protein